VLGAVLVFRRLGAVLIMEFKSIKSPLMGSGGFMSITFHTS